MDKRHGPWSHSLLAWACSDLPRHQGHRGSRSLRPHDQYLRSQVQQPVRAYSTLRARGGCFETRSRRVVGAEEAAVQNFLLATSRDTFYCLQGSWALSGRQLCWSDVTSEVFLLEVSDCCKMKDLLYILASNLSLSPTRLHMWVKCAYSDGSSGPDLKVTWASKAGGMYLATLLGVRREHEIRILLCFEDEDSPRAGFIQRWDGNGNELPDVFGEYACGPRGACGP